MLNTYTDMEQNIGFILCLVFCSSQWPNTNKHFDEVGLFFANPLERDSGYNFIGRIRAQY